MNQTETINPPTTPQGVNQRLKSERVQDALKAMPGWRQSPQGQAIDRAFEFPSSQVAAAFAGFVSAFAGHLGHTINLSIARNAVVLTLTGPKRKGRQGDLTEAMLEFARKLG